MAIDNFKTLEKKNNQDVKKVFSAVLHNWYWCILFIALSVIGTRLFLKYATPKYRINAKLIVEDNQKGGGGFGLNKQVMEQFDGIFSAKSNVDNEVEILQTRYLMNKVVRELS